MTEKHDGRPQTKAYASGSALAVCFRPKSGLGSETLLKVAAHGEVVPGNGKSTLDSRYMTSMAYTVQYMSFCYNNVIYRCYHPVTSLFYSSIHPPNPIIVSSSFQSLTGASHFSMH
jgi:hypothetical protein